MTDLRIAPGLTLPAANAATETYAILARKGAGKTYTGLVMSEEMIGAGIQVVVLDPLGAWWGLRSSADGRKAGLPVTILGGEHGDVPLEPTAGKLIADLVVEHATPFILDLSGFESNAAQDRFVTDFAERLYRAKAKAEHRQPLHLMVDEADSFAPQRPMPGQQRMLGAFEAIVRRGRIRGLGATLITQRPAVLNKNVLTQIECLVVLQMTAPQDRDAIDAWVAGNGTKEERNELIGSLASLETGDAWFWSPAWLRVFKRVHVRKRHTYDSSRTPEAGEQPVVPTKLAPVDLDALRGRIAETIETAKANDPAELRRQIKTLERELRDARKAAPAEKVVERVEVPVLADEQVIDLTNAAKYLIDIGASIIEALAEAQAQPEPAPKVRLPSPAAPPPRAPRRESPAAGSGGLDKAQRLVLTVLAQHPEGRDRTQLAILTGYSVKASTIPNALGALRTAGYVTPKGTNPVRATDEGIAALGDYEELPTGDDLLAWWMGRLGKADKLVLEVLVVAYPGDVSKAEICERTGYSETASTVPNALGKLRSLHLVSGLRAADDLMDAVRA